MLKKRLLVGTIIITLLTALLIADGYLDGTISRDIPDKSIKGTLFCLLIILFNVPAVNEIKNILAATNIKPFGPVLYPIVLALTTGWYWAQFAEDYYIYLSLYYLISIIVSLYALFFYQSKTSNYENMIANTSGNFFAASYLGLLAGFVLAMRIDGGFWHIVTYLIVIKSADIGAYSIGKRLGRTKFSPKISPSKSWEGMLGAVIFAGIASVLTARLTGIMSLWPAIAFGVIFAFAGQLGDLVESMMKRDAGIKDSGNLPGLGGVLDMIDSLLAAAPAAFCYLKIFAN